MEWLKQFARLFGWKNKQYEALLEFNEGGYKVRLWITQPTLDQAINPVVTNIHGIIRSSFAANRPVRELFVNLMDLPDVACVAIVNDKGNGASAYPDWH